MNAANGMTKHTDPSDATPTGIPAALWWEEPYRLFFPLGVLWSLLGVGYWLLKGHVAALDTIPPQWHAWLQIYGFMGSFIIGFLATAVPRFADARVLTRGEVGVLLAGTQGAALAVVFGVPAVAHAAFLLSVLSLAIMMIPRFRTRQGPLPPTFIFIPFGLFSAAVGSGLQCALAGGMIWHAGALRILSQQLLFQGVILFMILGVGGVLIRFLLGWSSAPMHAGEEARGKTWLVDLHALCAVGLLGSFWLEAFATPRSGAVLRALLVSVVAVAQFRAHRWPKGNMLGAHWLRFAVWLLLLGLWGDAVMAGYGAAYRMAFLHLCYAGGFAMITVAVATRVILSHAGWKERLTGSYWPFNVAQVLLVLGAVSRFGADFSPNSYHRHLLYAALCWLLGMLVWSATILWRVATRRPS